MSRKMAIAAGVFFATVAPVGLAHASLVYSYDRTAFELANPGFSVEDFESNTVGDLTYVDPIPFVQNGVTYDTLLGPTTTPPDPPDNLVWLTAAGTQTSNVLFENYFADTLTIDFGTGITGVGLDIFTEFANDNVTVSAYDSSSTLLGSTVLAAFAGGTPTFLGIVSTSEIAQLRLRSSLVDVVNGTSVGVDNLLFGLATVPLPAALPLFGSALGALGLAGWVRRRRIGFKTTS